MCSSMPEVGQWSLSQEQALCLADPNGPVDLPGAYNIVEATFHALGRTLETSSSGEGMEWGEHHPVPVRGHRAFLPRRLQRQSDQRLAARPRRCRRQAAARREGRRRRLRSRRQHHPDGEGLSRTRSSSATTITPHRSGSHASGPPRRARATRGSRSRDAVGYAEQDSISSRSSTACTTWAIRSAWPGTRAGAERRWHGMIVEPFANDRGAGQPQPGRPGVYGASTLICVPVSLARKGPALGAQAGERDSRGRRRRRRLHPFRRATETPFNLVLEARP